MAKKKTTKRARSSGGRKPRPLRYGPAGETLRAQIAETEEGRRELAKMDAMQAAIAPIAAAMAAEGITHRELAERLGVTRQRARQILSGDENLGLDTLAEAYFALGLRMVISAGPLARGGGQ